VNPEDVPSLSVLSPEPNEAIPFDTFPSSGALTVRIQGNFAFADSPDDDSPGVGFVDLTVDGNTQRLTSGPLSGGLEVEVTIERTPGPHRIAAVAVRPDGTPFTGPMSTVTELFWLDDGVPAVAITNPWPGSEFPLGTPMIDVEVATLNFTMREAEMMMIERVGHAHVHYDDVFPACADDDACDRGYLTIVSPPRGQESDRASSSITLPESAATTATLTAILRQDNHEPYRHPFGDPQGDVIFDTIEIVRVGQ
jgi:hypothetical protein